jgi:hypothetical protein
MVARFDLISALSEISKPHRPGNSFRLTQGLDPCDFRHALTQTSALASSGTPGDRSTKQLVRPVSGTPPAPKTVILTSFSGSSRIKLGSCASGWVSFTLTRSEEDLASSEHSSVLGGNREHAWVRDGLFRGRTADTASCKRIRAGYLTVRTGLNTGFERKCDRVRARR